MSRDPSSIVTRVFYGAAVLLVAFLFAVGSSYYLSPVSERPHSPMHEALKPGGVWGHGLGVLGSAMILALFTYSIRKKRVWPFRWGRLSRWLDVHIFFGLVGPLLITLHTALKFNGIVTISYLSMMTVMLSGIFGRYVYMQIPRDTRGDAMTLDDIQRRSEEIDRRLEDEYGLPDDVRRRVATIMKTRDWHRAGLVGALLLSVFDDMVLLGRIRRLRRYMRKRRKRLAAGVMPEIIRLSRERSVLQRRVATLNAMKRTFYYWHVFHKPFAYIMIVIMFFHIAVTISFGYRWIF